MIVVLIITIGFTISIWWLIWTAAFTTSIINCSRQWFTWQSYLHDSTSSSWQKKHFLLLIMLTVSVKMVLDKFSFHNFTCISSQDSYKATCCDVWHAHIYLIQSCVNLEYRKTTSVNTRTYTCTMITILEQFPAYKIIDTIFWKVLIFWLWYFRIIVAQNNNIIGYLFDGYTLSKFSLE